MAGMQVVVTACDAQGKELRGHGRFESQVRATASDHFAAVMITYPARMACLKHKSKRCANWFTNTAAACMWTAPT